MRRLRARRQLEAQHEGHAAAFGEYAAALAATRQVRLDGPAPDAGERRLGGARAAEKRRDPRAGPFLPPRYGLAWLRQKAAGEDFQTAVALTQRGHYVLFEALNFADGTRNLLEIRAAVSAEHGPVGLGTTRAVLPVPRACRAGDDERTFANAEMNHEIQRRLALCPLPFVGSPSTKPAAGFRARPAYAGLAKTTCHNYYKVWLVPP